MQFEEMSMANSRTKSLNNMAAAIVESGKSEEPTRPEARLTSTSSTKQEAIREKILQTREGLPPIFVSIYSTLR